MRTIKTVMILMLGLFALVGGCQNLLQYSSDTALVAQVVAGAGATGVAEWQKIESPVLVTLCWSVIPLSKFATAALCLWGAWQMWSARAADVIAFQRAKYFPLLGCGVMLAMLFGVFILITETWFQQWQTELGGAVLGAAERYMIAVAVLAFFVSMRDELP